MLKSEFPFQKCSPTTTEQLAISRTPNGGAKKFTSFTQYTKIHEIIAGGRYFPRYVIIFGGFLLFPNKIKGAARVEKVVSAIIAIDIYTNIIRPRFSF
jgi:hypothetical protein